MTARPLPVAYLVGTSHCGSTLMALLMNAHPQVAGVGETSPNRRAQRSGPEGFACSCGEALSACPFWARVFERVRAAGFPMDAGHWSNDYRYKPPLLHKLLTDHPSAAWAGRLQAAADRWLPVHRGRVGRTHRANRAFMEAVLAETGAAVFFDTSKALGRLKHLMDAPDLDLKVVRMVRDARAYANSIHRRGAPVDHAALRWRKFQAACDRLLMGLAPERVHLLRYEDLCRDPAGSLKALYAFLGVEALEPPAFVVPREQHVIGNRMRLKDRVAVRFDEGWREQLGPDEQARVLAVAGDLNRRLGYA